MAYTIGQKVCLWRVKHNWGLVEIRVLKEVIVTITEVKTGVPGEFSRDPVSSQSLRGIGDDGKTYEKHWDSWPESQTNDFIDSWSMRDDGEGDDQFWVPMEAVYIYDAASRRREPPAFTLIDQSDAPIKPKGDVVYCEKHDHYSHKDGVCIFCLFKRVA